MQKNDPSQEGASAAHRKTKEGFTEKLGDSIERVGDKIEEMGAGGLGRAIHRAGDKVEHMRDENKDEVKADDDEVYGSRH